MYSEQMMRETGFDDGPGVPDGHVHGHHLARLPDHPRRPDAPGRDVARRGDRLPHRAHGLRARRTPGRRSAATRTRRATSSRTCWARSSSSACARRSAGGAATRSASRRSTTRCCATGRCRSRSSAASCTRRADAVAMDVIPSIDVEKGRSRVVYWPGASAGIGAPTDRPDRIAEQFVAQGARIIHLVDFDGAKRQSPADLEVVGAVAGGSRCRSRWRAGSRRRTTSGSRSPPAPRGRSCPSR